ALADILRGGITETLGPQRVEAERNDRLAILEGLLGARQVLTGNHHALLQWQLFLAAARRTLDDFAGQRHLAAGDRILIDQAKGYLRRRTDQVLEMLRILDTRQLDNDPIIALANDGRLLGPRLVDAPADDFDRLVDRLNLQLRCAGLGELDRGGA